MAWQSFGTQQRGTKRTMGLLYIILSLLLNDEVHSAFEVSKVRNLLPWAKALHHCNTIRRNLTFAVPVVDLSLMTVLDKIDLQGEAWVGYFQTYEYFRFIVCVPLSEIELSVSATFNIGRLGNRPGLCYSLCGLQGHIGLQVDVCYCIETRTFSTPDIHSVNTSCEDPLHCVNGMLCGNREYNKISVYKKVSISSNDIRGDGSGCLIVTKRREYEISVANCSDRFQHLCESSTGQNLYLEESPTNDQWLYSISDCPKTGKKPTTFIGDRTKFVFPNINGSWWTSVVRDLVIRNCSESMTIIGTPLYEGFLRNSPEGTKLEFIHAWTNSRKMFVACMSAQPSNAQKNRTNEKAETTVTSAPSQATTISPIPGKKSTPKVKGVKKTTRSKERASTMMSPSTHKTTTALLASEQPSNEQETSANDPEETTITSAASETPTTSLIPVSTVTLPIGLAALALITVVALCIVCWRRRRQVSQESVNLTATHCTRDQHAVQERQITNPPSTPSRHIQTKNKNRDSSYLTVNFGRGRQDFSIEQPGCSHFD